MATTRSRTGASDTKKKSVSSATSKVKSSAGKTATPGTATRPRTKQSAGHPPAKAGKNWKWEHSAEESERQKKLPKKDWSKEKDIHVLRARVIELEAIVLEKNKMLKYVERDNQRYEAGYDPFEEWDGDDDDCPPPSEDWSD